MTDNKENAVVQDDSLYNQQTKAIPKPSVGIGIDTEDTFFNNIIGQGVASNIDISKINTFSQTAQSREQVYQMIDAMCEDDIMSAVLETYAEDATEPNDAGQIMWCESDDSHVSSMVNYLLDTMRIDKHIYGWIHSLCKYGDVYLRLYRQSELKDDLFDLDSISKLDEIEEKKSKSTLNEEIKIKAYSKDDNYAHYIESVKNPAEVFELTRFGKTYGYIKADVKTQGYKNQNQPTGYYQYAFKEQDIEIYSAVDFVHACLVDDSNRVSEEVNIFLDKGDENDMSVSYNVRRGKSLFYNLFKIWRQLALLENSVLLNRLTKSSIVRAISVEVGDMPKEQVGPHLQNIKALFEQKNAFDVGTSYEEYTNPGPIENNIYIPTRNQKGAMSISSVGGDVDVKGLADLDYFKNKLFGGLRVPKQYFGDTDDSAGFNGGTSLSLISSRYAKMIKRIQNTMIQAITDAINLMLLDKGLNSYINKFTIRMQTPTTQEEVDRRESTSNKIAVASDMMNMFSDIEDPVSKLKILKTLISNVVTDDEIIQILQKEIEKLEQEGVDASGIDDTDIDDAGMNDTIGGGVSDTEPLGLDGEEEPSLDEPLEAEPEMDDSETLPTPNDLGVDMTDNAGGEE
jgi:hypothetical protein